MRRLAGHPMCAGIGECGVGVVNHNLACMACRSMAERQLAVFKAQANIAGSHTFTRYAPDTVQGAASAWGLALQLGASFPQLSTQLSIPVVSSGAQSIGLQARESPRTHEDGLLSSRKSAPRLGKERRAAASSCARAQTQRRGKQGAWAEKNEGLARSTRARAKDKLKFLARTSRPRIVAVGEIGLDYNQAEFCPLDLQADKVHAGTKLDDGVQLAALVSTCRADTALTRGQRTRAGTK